MVTLKPSSAAAIGASVPVPGKDNETGPLPAPFVQPLVGFSHDPPELLIQRPFLDWYKSFYTE